jgi:hypothetical protein
MTAAAAMALVNPASTTRRTNRETCGGIGGA